MAFNLTSYAQAISGIPILSADEERRLAEDLYYPRRFRRGAPTGYVTPAFCDAHCAQLQRQYGLPQADLVQEGNIGLMKAVKRFNPEKACV